MRPDLPTGTVTFLFTDVEGSTRLLEEIGDESYEEALSVHRRIVRAACQAHDGVEVDTQGDAFFFAFPEPSGALAAAQQMTEGLGAGRIQVRVGLHTGTPRLGEEGYVGSDVHFGARVAASAHGGQVVLSQATRDLVDGYVLTHLGEHRLKDIEHAVDIFQLGDESFPPLKTISNTNLPRPASSFVGREPELEDVRALIEEGARLVTLTGPGGSGKTRLALEAASTLVPEYKAGVFWVGLAALRDPALVTETIAQTLGAKDGLAEHIGERELLLLLDNLEQVIAAAPELSSLLQGCPNLTLLVTSRELLRVQGEVEYEVPPLQEPEAVSLFRERSQLEPSDEMPELCRRLDLLPLAVELAAARTKALSPKQILERLSQRLDLLKGGRDTDPRQQTLRATIEWSYDLLSEEEQRLFRALSVFAGGCTLQAAEEIADADLDTLQSLVEKSLLRFTNERYWMLETIREYAGERLAKSGEAGNLAQHHVQHFLELAETAEPELWAQHTDVWLPRLDPEEGNFRAALGSAIGRAEVEIAVRLAGSLYPFWEIRARHAEARTWLNQALALGGAVAPSCRAKALVAAARATTWQSDWPTAIPLLEEAVALSRKLNDVEGVGRCLGFIGHACLYTGDSEGAAAAFNEGVELARSTGDRRSLARALYNAAWAAIEKRDFDRAREMFEEAAGIFRADGMKPNLALSLMRLGYSEALAGDFERAASRLDESIVLFDELGTTTWTPVAHRYLGLLALLRGRIDEADSLLRTSLMEGREQAPQFDLPHWIEELAAVAAAKGDAVRAATLWGATDALFEMLGLTTLEENRQVRELFRNEVGRSLDSDAQAEAMAQGHAMTLQQAVAYALSEKSGQRSTSPSRPSPP
jgi:predicted ATPase